VRTADFRSFPRKYSSLTASGSRSALDGGTGYRAGVHRSLNDSKTAWATLQENNAIAIIDIPSATVLAIKPLGTKNHNLPGNGLDASDRDNAINIANWPLKGLFLPDGIGAYKVADQTFLVTANEGDTRNYTDFGGTYNEESRVGSLKLDPTAFPTGNDLKSNAKLGRLKVTNTKGFYIDNLGQKVFTELFSFGATLILDPDLGWQTGLGQRGSV
jgi:hypothetical protein